MKRLFYRLFPKRAGAIEEFVYFIMFNGCANVEIMAKEHDLGQPGFAGLSINDLSQDSMIVTEYQVVCSATAPSGKKMKYVYHHEASFASMYELHFTKNEFRQKLLAYEKQCAESLKKLLPEVKIDVFA